MVVEGAADSLSSQPLLVVVSGLSGAGLTTTLNTLEDLGFYCIDNLPAPLALPTVDFLLAAKRHGQKFALGMDIRSPEFAHHFAKVRDELANRVTVMTLFLTASEEVLLQRFSATRRRHPLDSAGASLEGAIRRERETLAILEETSEIVIDTTHWNPHVLARAIEQHFAHRVPRRKLVVTVSSFGFKYGLPRNIDSVYDVRFLANPNFDERLRNKNGLDADVQAFVETDPRSDRFLSQLEKLHLFLLPQYYGEGKHRFAVGFGCTGGQHRSVFVAETLAKRLMRGNMEGIAIELSHRDIRNAAP